MVLRMTMRFGKLDGDDGSLRCALLRCVRYADVQWVIPVGGWICNKKASPGYLSFFL